MSDDKTRFYPSDGGPAFPVNGPNGDHPGMSLREWFAGQALAGLHSLSSDPVINAIGREAKRLGEERMSTTFARMAVEAADATIAELAKEQQR